MASKWHLKTARAALTKPDIHHDSLTYCVNVKQEDFCNYGQHGKME